MDFVPYDAGTRCREGIWTPTVRQLMAIAAALGGGGLSIGTGGSFAGLFFRARYDLGPVGGVGRQQRVLRTNGLLVEQVLAQIAVVEWRRRQRTQLGLA